jgi:hypothetical protein
LILKFTGTQIATKEGFESKHGGLGYRAAVIVVVLLPLFAPMLTDVAQVLIKGMGSSLAIALLPDFGIFAGGITALAPFAAMSS